MIGLTGARYCDKEIWSRSKQIWVCCRQPAKACLPSDYIGAGIDLCERHAARSSCQGFLDDCTTTELSPQQSGGAP